MVDTVSILRGLKERYENHHGTARLLLIPVLSSCHLVSAVWPGSLGVRILDSSLVVAAQLSSRYISGRFQPDKSIDLLDMAAANTRVQLDSQPEIIDRLERQELQLNVEATALAAEKDEGSKARLQVVKEQLARLREQLQPLRLQHEEEKKGVSRTHRPLCPLGPWFGSRAPMLM